MTGTASDLTPHHASCDCGALRLTVTGPPVHVHACTCTICQRRSGSVMTVTAYFTEEAVTVIGPWTKRPRKDAEGQARYRAFCPTCGQTVFFTSAAYPPATLAVPAGCFADPDFPAPDFVIYWADRPRWLGAPPDIPLFGADDGDQ